MEKELLDRLDRMEQNLGNRVEDCRREIIVVAGEIRRVEQKVDDRHEARGVTDKELRTRIGCMQRKVNGLSRESAATKAKVGLLGGGAGAMAAALAEALRRLLHSG